MNNVYKYLLVDWGSSLSLLQYSIVEGFTNENLNYVFYLKNALQIKEDENTHTLSNKSLPSL